VTSYRNFIRVYTGAKAVYFLFMVVIVLDALFLVRTFYPPWFEFVLQRHLFEFVVLTALSVVLMLLLRLVDKPTLDPCDNEHDCQELVRRAVREDSRAALLKVHSAGLRSRQHFITSLTNVEGRPIPIAVLAQNPATALDELDATSTNGILDNLERGHKDVPLEIRLFDTPATMRSLILCDSKKKPILATVSWYTYKKIRGETDTTKIQGRINPAIVLVADSSAEDRAVLTFLDKEFDKMWLECKDARKFVGAVSEILNISGGNT
jgi:hypothetical protein